MAKLREILSPFAWKYVGKSVIQKGDPTARHVVHVKKWRPFAFLLMPPPSYGKTYVANSVFPKAAIPKVMGDVLLDEIAAGKRPVSKNLKALVDRAYKSGEVDRLTIIEEIFAKTWRMISSSHGPGVPLPRTSHSTGLFPLDTRTI